MDLRRLISALITLAFTLALCAPTFAGATMLALEETDACGCSSEPAPNSVSHPSDCMCADCGCVIKQLPTQLPHDGVTTLIAPMLVAVVADTVVLPATDQPPLERAYRPAFPRGPPDAPHSPLYILYDSLLI